MNVRLMQSPPRIKSYWWKGRPNFGDRLAPLLLAHFGNVISVWADRDKAQVISVGSVLELVPSGWDGYIVGAGKLFQDRPIILPPRDKILAIRGPLSAAWVQGSYAIGDPGLLADEMIALPPKEHDLGVLPHWSDRKLARDPRFLLSDPLIISPATDPLTVIRQIGSCRQIVTSSLHGMIVADAFGIPRRFEYTRRLDKEGGDYKFRDYSASINAPFEPGRLIEASRSRVEDRKHELSDAYRELGRVIRRTDGEVTATRKAVPSLFKRRGTVPEPGLGRDAAGSR